MAVTPVLYPAGESTDYRPKLPKPIKQAKSAFNSTVEFLNISRVVVNVVEASGKSLPLQVSRLLGCMQVYSGIAGIFAVPEFCVNIISALYAKNLVRRIISLARAILDAGSIMGAINSVISGLKAVKVISEKAICWTGLVGKVLYPLQFLSFALNTYELRRTWKTRQLLLANTETLAKEESKTSRIEKLKQGLVFIQDNHKEIRKGLSIAKHALIDKRARECLADLEYQKEEAILKAEELVYTLRRHATRKLGFQSTLLAVRIAGVVGSTLTLVTPPNPFTFGTVAAAAILGLMVNGLQSIMTPKNPFDPPKIVRLIHSMYERLRGVAS